MVVPGVVPGRPVPARWKVTVPDAPFTVPVKISVSWPFALPSAWMIKVPVKVDVPVNVPVQAVVAVTSKIVLPPAERGLAKIADVSAKVPLADVGGDAAALVTTTRARITARVSDKRRRCSRAFSI